MGFSLVLIYGKVVLNHLSTKGLLSHGSKDPLAGQSLSFWVSDCPFNADAPGRGFFSRKVCLGVPPFIRGGGNISEPEGRDLAGRRAREARLWLTLGGHWLRPVCVYDLSPRASIRWSPWAQQDTGRTGRLLPAPGRTESEGLGEGTGLSGAQPLCSLRLCSASLGDPWLKGPARLPAKRTAG